MNTSRQADAAAIGAVVAIAAMTVLILLMARVAAAQSVPTDPTDIRPIAVGALAPTLAARRPERSSRSIPPAWSGQPP